VTALLNETTGHADLLDLPLAVKPGERALYVMRGVGLFEPRSAGGSWVGRSSGVSVPIGDTRMRPRVGQSKGHYVPEAPTVIDAGYSTITDRRIVLQGTKQIRLLTRNRYPAPWPRPGRGSSARSCTRPDRRGVVEAADRERVVERCGLSGGAVSRRKVRCCDPGRRRGDMASRR
jgi:hypothetical protein